MFFELSDALLDDILFSMEDQTGLHFIDGEKGCVVKAEEGSAADGERLFTIPVWSSKDGYSMLEEFTDCLQAPLVKQELRQVLISGRGVFRNFKNVLKQYPEIERRFNFFKHEKMKARVMQWYNGLCEAWGLEGLAAVESDNSQDTEELVQNDFQFSEYDPVSDRDDVLHGNRLLTEELKYLSADKKGDAVVFLWQQCADFAAPEDKRGFICRTDAEDFTGFILCSFCPSGSYETVVITDFYVLPNYRGLGIGRKLLSQCLEAMKNDGIRFVLISNIIVQQSLEAMLLQMGFEKLGSGYAADLSKEN